MHTIIVTMELKLSVPLTSVQLKFNPTYIVHNDCHGTILMMTNVEQLYNS